MLSKEMIASARRFKEALDAAIARPTDGRLTTNVDVIEMHEAILGLIWATHTRTLEEALDVLSDYEAT